MEPIVNIQKILIANRGEIACRVIETCRKIGIKSVAVYSDADVAARHVRLADEAVHIGPASASESYLQSSRIIDAAKQTGADAIHPGYGFLSENPDFANACKENGIRFIGPSAESMKAMALKGAAKALMIEANVPVVPGYHGDDQSLETLTLEAERIGYPVLLKAVAGGGGKGMRRVDNSKDIAAAIDSARREGENSFGNGQLLVEKLIERPRHIEIQVFGDSHGNAVHLWERDCSLQRRHQKVVEEAPAPNMPENVRKAMGGAAVRAAQAIQYAGAGTIEFIVDGSKELSEDSFYFMEMNTRLQVEHPVTECITGTDLVEWQIRVADGQHLPKSQPEIDAQVSGHAFEVRLYAEDPYNDFMPAIGSVKKFKHPVSTSSMRIDTGIETGDAISIHYDPMVAKLISYGADRQQALMAMKSLLEQTSLIGLTSNRDFLKALISHEDFGRGDVHTGFIADNSEQLLTSPAVTSLEFGFAALATHLNRPTSHLTDDPWCGGDAFRLNMSGGYTERFEDGDGVEVACYISASANEITVTALDECHSFTVLSHSLDTLEVRHSGKRLLLTTAVETDTVTVVTPDKTITLKRHSMNAADDQATEGPGNLMAPMPGKILEVLVSNGDAVEAGQPLLVMEAMKMEQTLSAPRSGTIAGLNLKAGDQVGDGSLLLEVHEQSE
ncbi:biotin carboxylase [Kordiimonas sediminis]|uniref:Biotin carboxylase n=1 Tax=Kordiimonas sediminis TaxID=1735581 RepID=A0A919AUL1_9PROT|nr:acetyl/propionyl/methylcrotonyl-CoA carboxylase subunit alpha [Kordiimonas sediminis]GHF26929.1 biotin carboxylase [Kordiimonas sediminis]